ncbi:MAG: hypothetical protein NVS3B10_16560 [Polyangiales bacterium]
MRALATLAALAMLFGSSSCALAPPAVVPAWPPLTVVDTTGASTTLPADLGRSKLTVLVFYAEHCPCFRVHEARLVELARSYAERGVRVVVVDSEVSASAERDGRAARERGLPAIAIDPGGRLADAVGAEYATYSVVLDPQGRVRYRGGIDSDKDRLRDATQAFLRDAIDDLLAGREPRVAEGKALGCALQKH